MKNTLKISMLTLALASALVITSCATSETVVVEPGQSVEFISVDKYIEMRAKDMLTKAVPNGRFVISSYGRNVLLAGQVPGDNDGMYRRQAETVVKTIPEVKSVRNKVTTDSIENADDIARDNFITTEAKNVLIGMGDELKIKRMKVVTVNGVVYLEGYNVGKVRDLDKAISKIRRIEGVRSVDNLTY